MPKDPLIITVIFFGDERSRALLQFAVENNLEAAERIEQVIQELLGEIPPEERARMEAFIDSRLHVSRKN